MSNTPFISVIVPNYNHERYLRKRLDSIFNQTYQNFEVILLDDNSLDNSREILSEYAVNPKVSNYIFNSQNSGSTFVQWKAGIDLAKGEYIWIAESDDYCSSNFLETVIQPLLLDRNVVLSYCQSNRVDKTEKITGNWITHTNDLDEKQFLADFILDGNLFNEKYLIFKNVIPNASAVLMKKSEIIRSRFLENETILRHCGDWQLYFQLIMNNKIAFISESYNNFRYHDDSVIASATKSLKRIHIIDVDFQMRKGMVREIKIQKPYNASLILENNRKVIQNLKYEKAFIYIQNKQKIKGLFILISNFSFFQKKYKLRKNLILKFKKMLL